MESSGHQRTTAGRASRAGARRGRGLLAAGAAGLLVLSGCGSSEEDPQPAPSADGPVLVGAGPTVQTQAVADAWVLALEDSGIPAEVREVEGGRAGYLGAVDDGTLDVYPDFTGDLYLELDAAAPLPGQTASPSASAPASASASASPSSAVPEAEERGLVDSLTSLLGQSPGSEGFTDADVEAALDQHLPEGVELLPTASADRTRAMAVTAATGAELTSPTLESLAEECSQMAIGVPQEEDEQPVTVPALETLYDCRPEEVVSYGSPEEAVDALLRDEVQAAVVVTTRPEIPDNALVVLEDDEGAMITQRVVPVADEQLPDDARRVLDDVGGRLDSSAMLLLTRMTTSSTPYSPYEAAEYWWGTQQ